MAETNAKKDGFAEQGENYDFSFRDAVFKGAFIRNPVLIQFAGLAPIVAAATSVQTAGLLSIVFFLVMLTTEVMANLIYKKLTRWLRVTLYLLTGAAVVCPSMFVIDHLNPELKLGAGVFLPVLAISSITVLHCEKLAIGSSLKTSVFDSMATSLGYSAVMIVVGAIREIFGAGKIAGFSLPTGFTLPALLYPFGGFLVLAFLAALLRWSVLRFYPEYEDEIQLKISQTVVKMTQESERHSAENSSRIKSGEKKPGSAPKAAQRSEINVDANETSVVYEPETPADREDTAQKKDLSEKSISAAAYSPEHANEKRKPADLQFNGAETVAASEPLLPDETKAEIIPPTADLLFEEAAESERALYNRIAEELLSEITFDDIELSADSFLAELDARYEKRSKEDK